jgi:hypothetical protein
MGSSPPSQESRARPSGLLRRSMGACTSRWLSSFPAAVSTLRRSASMRLMTLAGARSRDLIRRVSVSGILDRAHSFSGVLGKRFV